MEVELELIKNEKDEIQVSQRAMDLTMKPKSWASQLRS